MENSTWCSLDGPGCNIWKNTSNLVQNRSWLTETNLINTTCNGSMVNGDCIVRYSMILEPCFKNLLENILEEKKWRIWLCVTLKFRNYLIEFCLLRQKRWTPLQCPPGARWTVLKIEQVQKPNAGATKSFQMEIKCKCSFQVLWSLFYFLMVATADVGNIIGKQWFDYWPAQSEHEICDICSVFSGW